MQGRRIFTADEVARLMTAGNPRQRIMVLLSVTYCARIAETLALTFGDFAGERLTIQGLNDGKTETYPIPATVRQALDALRQEYVRRGITVLPTTPLLVSRKGRQHAITVRQAIRELRALCDACGIHEKIGTHSLRKTGATHYYEHSGYNVQQTRRYTRHKSLAALQRYIGTTGDLDLVHIPIWEERPV
jgi:integrase